jgi:hypothetical protein
MAGCNLVCTYTASFKWLVYAFVCTACIIDVHGYTLYSPLLLRRSFPQSSAISQRSSIGFTKLLCTKPISVRPKICFGSQLRCQESSANSDGLPTFDRMAAVAGETWDGVLAKFTANGAEFPMFHSNVQYTLDNFSYVGALISEERVATTGDVQSRSLSLSLDLSLILPPSPSPPPPLSLSLAR